MNEKRKSSRRYQVYRGHNIFMYIYKALQFLFLLSVFTANILIIELERNGKLYT